MTVQSDEYVFYNPTSGGFTAAGATAPVVGASASGGIPAWAASTVYALNQLVTNGGSTYICTTAHTSGATFSAESTDWQQFGSGAVSTAVVQASSTPATAPGVQWVYNVKDGAYGAKGDGTTDDTAAIVAAIAAAAGSSIGVSGHPGGATVYLPQGQYLISSTITVPDTVRLVGDGPNSGPWPNSSGNNLGTRILASSSFPWSCPMLAIGARLPAVVTTGVVFSTQIVGMTIDGQNYAMVGIYTNKAQEHCRVDYVTVQKCSMIGIHVGTPNSSSGGNQTNNFGMANLKIAPTHNNAYVATTLNGAITVASGTNPVDANSNYCNTVTTSGQATGTVVLTSTASLPTSGCVIITQQSQQAPVVVYYSGVSGNNLTGCYTDATSVQTPALSFSSSAQVESPACGVYIQNVGAMRGIQAATFDSGFASATCVGLRLDGANGRYERIHCEHVKYGILIGSASMCNAPSIDHVMLGGDNTVVDLIRIGTAGSSNGQNCFSLRNIMRYVSGPNTINDLANSNTITDQYVTEYTVGVAGYGLGGNNTSRTILSTSDQVLTKFGKGFVGPTKSGSDFSDADFVNPVDGLSGYRTDNGSFQWRAGGSWYTSANFTTGAAPYYPWSANALLGWSFDPLFNNTGTALTNGQLMLTKVMVTPGSTLSNLLAYVSTAGTSLTTGQNLAGIYNSSGTLIGSTADQTTNWASTGLKTMALSVQSGQSLTLSNAASWVYAALLTNGGGTVPVFAIQPGNTTSGIAEAGLTASGGFRGGTILTGQTALPTSITLGSVSSIGNIRWAGVS